MGEVTNVGDAQGLRPCGYRDLEAAIQPHGCPHLAMFLDDNRGSDGGLVVGGGDDGARHHLLRERRQEPQEQGEEE